MSSIAEDKKGKEILQIVDLVANEKNVDKSIIFSALESALAAVALRDVEDKEADVRVSIDSTTGKYNAARYWEVVADDSSEDYHAEREITLDEAKKQGADLVVGDLLSEDLEVDDLSRIGASQARQIIMRLVRDAERQKLVSMYEKRIGEIVSGQVKKVLRDGLIIDLFDGTEAIMRKPDMIYRENFHIGDRVRSHFSDVNRESRGPLVVLSRASVEFMLSIFCLEVPEVEEGQIEIKASAREAGYRSKIAVKSKDNRVDPIGACVGMRGARVQSISNELNGERIDIILWDDNPVQLVVNALAPADVKSVTIDEETKSMDIAVDEEQLSQAIGRNGQNVRLASELTGWTLNIMTEQEVVDKGQRETKMSREDFIEKLGIDDEVATILIREGITSIETLSHIGHDSLAEIEEFDEDIATALLARAQDALLSAILTVDSTEVPADMAALNSMTDEVGKKLVLAGINTCDDLADYAVHELIEEVAMDEELAGKLIMEARESWDNDSNNKA
jgi:transcription termination/antitermination protein NusA|tara:strand:+ start:316 stop:1836 length:1521 start_codon:yes stop_codon:yes gene_type:complete